MSRSEGFFFNVKQWLGDDAVLLMDWDTRAIHLHLMCLAWQQDPPGVLPDDDALLRRWAGSPGAQDWASRIRPQLLRAWKLCPEGLRQDGLVREAAAAQSTSKKRSAAARVRWDRERSLAAPDGEVAEPDQGAGFSLEGLLLDSAAGFSRASDEERASIWTMGVALLRHDAFDDAKIRAFLGRKIQECGEKRVAEAIAQLSLKKIPAADAKAYLASILKGEETKRKRRGGVAL